MAKKINIYLDDEAKNKVDSLTENYKGEEYLIELKKYFAERSNYINRTTGWDFSRLAWAVYTNGAIVHGN